MIALTRTARTKRYATGASVCYLLVRGMGAENMKRWICIVSLAFVFGVSSMENARAQFGYNIGPGIGYGSGYGAYGSGISLSVGRGIGVSSGSFYSTGNPYGVGYGTYRPYGTYYPYGGYVPLGRSPYGVGYSYLGPPVFTSPVIPRSSGRRCF